MLLADNDKRTPRFSRRDFVYDPGRDTYTCPRGVALPFASFSAAEQLKLYYTDPATCNACPLKARCTTTDQGRRVRRHVDEAFVERVRAHHGTAPYERARRKRQVWVVPLLAEAKDWHRLRRFRPRGLEKVNAEALVTAAGQNLRRLQPGRLGAATMARWGTRAPGRGRRPVTDHRRVIAAPAPPFRRRPLVQYFFNRLRRPQYLGVHSADASPLPLKNHERPTATPKRLLLLTFTNLLLSVIYFCFVRVSAAQPLHCQDYLSPYRKLAIHALGKGDVEGSQTNSHPIASSCGCNAQRARDQTEVDRRIL